MPRGVFWNDAPLRAASKRAFVAAAMKTKAQAQMLAPTPSIATGMKVRFVGVNYAVLHSGSPLSHLFELGTDPHPITPGASAGFRTRRVQWKTSGGQTWTGRVGRIGRKRGGKIAMKFPDGGFARGTVEHPGMQARPFLAPAGATFPAHYITAARLELAKTAASGLGQFRGIL